VNRTGAPSTVFGPLEWTRRDTVARRGVAAEEAEELRRRIEQWRLTRARQGQMPEELWRAAVSAAQRYGVSSVARALGVGHAGLKASCTEVPASGVTGTGAGSGSAPKLRRRMRPSVRMA